MKIQILFSSLCIALSSATRIGDITVTKITRILHGDGDENHFQIEITGGVSGADHFHLDFLHNGGADQISINSVAGMGLNTQNKATFKGNLNDYAGQNVEFILTQRDGPDTDNKLTYGDLPIKLPAFPTTAKSAWVGVKNDFSLRIADKTTIKSEGESFTYEDKTCTESDGDPCYFVDVSKAGGKVEFCITIDGVDVCDKTLTPTAVPGTTVDPDTTELKYKEEGADAEVTVTITHGSKAISSTEIIVYKEESTTAYVCTSTTCAVDDFTPKDELTVITVGIDDTNAPADTGSKKVTDYVLVGTVLSNSLIETRWTRQSSEDTYYVQTTGTADFTATTVTCQDADDGDDFHCFAYFTGLDGSTTYPLTVKITDDNAKVFVTLTDTATGADEKEVEMEMSSVNTKWNKGLRSFEVNACLHRVDTTDVSSYEAILINNMGQWKKANGVSQKFGNEFCFEEISLDGYSFNLSENLTLVALRRANDGITVLESIQTVISV